MQSKQRSYIDFLMAVSDKGRTFTKQQAFEILENVKGKTLGEVDSSGQFARTEKSPKITGIAGDVIEQSVFGYNRDSDQECDLIIDGILTELKTTGVRIPKSDFSKAKDKVGFKYNVYFEAKEGISITAVTFDPSIETDFDKSHFWEKSQHLLIVFYEYKSYDVVPAAEYASFPIVDYCYNTFSDSERLQLQNDWEQVRDYLQNIYSTYPDREERFKNLEGFTHVLRPNLLLIELVPGFKKRGKSYQKPRYRLKKTFIDYIVKGHFNQTRSSSEISLKESFSSFSELDARCHELSSKYAGKTFSQLKQELGIEKDVTAKDFGATCILKMFDANCKRLNQISDFLKAGIIAKSITLNPSGKNKEDMKLQRIDFEEWADRDVDFADSEIFTYFCEHSFLCPIFKVQGNLKRKNFDDDVLKEKEDQRITEEVGKTTFEGFKRFSFDDEFIEREVKRTWMDSRRLIYTNELVWEYEFDKNGEKIRNKSGSFKGSPNFPKGSEYIVFFRGGENDSSDKSRTESVNGIKMLPQYFWLKGSYIVDKLNSLPYL